MTDPITSPFNRGTKLKSIAYFCGELFGAACVFGVFLGMLFFL